MSCCKSFVISLKYYKTELLEKNSLEVLTFTLVIVRNLNVRQKFHRLCFFFSGKIQTSSRSIWSEIYMIKTQSIATENSNPDSRHFVLSICSIIIYDATLHRFDKHFNSFTKASIRKIWKCKRPKLKILPFCTYFVKMFSGQFVEINSASFSWLRFGKHLLNFIDTDCNKLPTPRLKVTRKVFQNLQHLLGQLEESLIRRL